MLQIDGTQARPLVSDRNDDLLAELVPLDRNDTADWTEAQRIVKQVFKHLQQLGAIADDRQGPRR